LPAPLRDQEGLACKTVSAVSHLDADAMLADEHIDHDGMLVPTVRVPDTVVHEFGDEERKVTALLRAQVGRDRLYQPPGPGRRLRPRGLL
jgi:hypothetical protein